MTHDQPPSWQLCSYPHCIGVRLATVAWCLTHSAELDASAVEAELKRINDEGTIDARGVQLSAELLKRILDAAPHQHGRLALKVGHFNMATFEGDATFRDAILGDVRFDDATFHGEARFSQATFQDRPSFHGATFQSPARFNANFQKGAVFAKAIFQDAARFDSAIFQGQTFFAGATFHGEAEFGLVTFRDGVVFAEATFYGVAWFEETTFERTSIIGPLLAWHIIFDSAFFRERVQINVAAAVLCARWAQFPAGVQFRLRWASVNLDDANLAAPAILAGVPPFAHLDEEYAARRWERLPPGPRRQRWRPRLLSLCQADVAGLRLANVDLRACRFAGAHNLDKLRIEGEPLFARTQGWWRARRKTLAEEQQWRVSRPRHWRPGGWYAPACQPPASLAIDPPGVLPPVQLAALYRELRKGREDAKDEPGAADFYYGEMELRRHNPSAPRAERLVLWLYWLMSGYGLRGLRAAAWLTVFVIGLAALLQSIGFDGGDPPFRDAVIYAAQSMVSIGSSNKALTDHVSSAGEMLRIALRLVGPLLLGLALLSVRNRVKR
jgi:uncharacterized protein YjbI with pentapeptide repeats